MKSKTFFKSLKLSFNNSHGMSIVEILIAITLVGLAGTFVVGKVFESLKEELGSDNKI